MANLEDVARLATSLPEVTEGERHGSLTWLVAGKVFLWERHFSKADIKRFCTVPPPPDPILAVRVADLDEKEAVLATSPEAVFTIPHFNGYPALLIQLDIVAEDVLEEAITDAWLACAPPPLAQRFLDGCAARDADSGAQ